MSFRPYQSKIRWKLLASIAASTLVLHVWAIILIKNLTFTSHSFSIPKQNHLAEDSLDLSSQTTKKRNQDLEHIFSRLMAKDVLPHDVKFDFNDLDPSSIPNEQISAKNHLPSELNILPKKLRLVFI